MEEKTKLSKIAKTMRTIKVIISLAFITDLNTNGTTKLKTKLRFKLKLIPIHFPKYNSFLVIGRVNIDLKNGKDSIKDSDENKIENNGMINRVKFNKVTIALDELSEEKNNTVEDKPNKRKVKKYNHLFLIVSLNSIIAIFHIGLFKFIVVPVN